MLGGGRAGHPSFHGGTSCALVPLPEEGPGEGVWRAPTRSMGVFRPVVAERMRAPSHCSLSARSQPHEALVYEDIEASSKLQQKTHFLQLLAITPPHDRGVTCLHLGVAQLGKDPSSAGVSDRADRPSGLQPQAGQRREPC